MLKMSSGPPLPPGLHPPGLPPIPMLPLPVWPDTRDRLQKDVNI